MKEWSMALFPFLSCTVQIPAPLDMLGEENWKKYPKATLIGLGFVFLFLAKAFTNKFSL